ncbi:hypothetical protein [Vibrio sp. Vb2201]|uniref:hypothetical protein n=1 Tax=Vibrio sp. Vb2201 TaxID=3074655 RepID=UPI002964FD8D|nr:hypothetical protein [Vibrio sp. Vb2201]MDW1798964.1 hypothetical protein [Vibrio sp. Vb2201]
MGSRISLFEFQVDMSIEDVANSLINMRYTIGKSSGFILKKVQRDRIFAKHVTEVMSERSVTSPYGDVEVSLIKDYLVNEFELSQGMLKINDATKSLAKLRSDLSSSLQYQCSISSLNLDLKRIAEEIAMEQSTINITSVDIVTYDLLPNSTSKMSITSNQCVMEKVLKHFCDKSFEVKKLGIETDLGKAEITQKGNVKIHETDKASKLFDVVQAKFLASRH